MKIIFLLWLIPCLVYSQEESEVGGMMLYKYGTGKNALISFHGKNGKYNDSATIIYDTERGNGVDLTQFTVYALQLNSGDGDWSKNDISAVFGAVKQDGFTSVDITGLSLGGMAVIRAMAYNADPDLTSWPKLTIKSCGIVCGKDDRKTYDIFAKTKIKAWHDPQDPTMPYSNMKTMIDSTHAHGGDAEMITIEGYSHNAWNYAYDRNKSENYYVWLESFYQEPIPPEVTADTVKSFVVIDNEIGLITTESGKQYNVELFPVSGTYGTPRYHHHWFGKRYRRIMTFFNLEINIKGKDYKKAARRY